MTTTTEKLLARAEEYQRKADALRLAAAELNGHLTERKVKQLPAVIERAVALDDARSQMREKQRASWTPERRAAQARRMRKINPHRKKALTQGQRRQERRAESAEILALFNETPKTMAQAGLSAKQGQTLGSLVRYGYLRRKDDGFVTTSKIFVR